jgi:hypothetical protein
MTSLHPALTRRSNRQKPSTTTTITTTLIKTRASWPQSLEPRIASIPPTLAHSLSAAFESGDGIQSVETKKQTMARSFRMTSLSVRVLPKIGVACLLGTAMMLSSQQHNGFGTATAFGMISPTSRSLGGGVSGGTLASSSLRTQTVPQRLQLQPTSTITRRLPLPSPARYKTVLYRIRCENKYYQLEEMEDRDNCTTELFLKENGEVLIGETDGPLWTEAVGKCIRLILESGILQRERERESREFIVINSFVGCLGIQELIISFNSLKLTYD